MEKAQLAIAILTALPQRSLYSLGHRSNVKMCAIFDPK